MKKRLQHLGELFSNNKKLLFFVSAFAISFLNTSLAQFYTYQTESFEADIWAAAPDNTNTIESSTGNWTVAKNNVQSDVYAQDGTYSLYFATKGGITSPKLEDGAGTLTFYINKPTGGTRKVSVEISTDNAVWTKIINEETIASGWAEMTSVINDETIRYIRISINSNSNVYIDNVLITKPDFSTSIQDNGFDKTLLKTCFYNLSGVRTTSLIDNTFYIQENVYEDGSMKRIKIYNKN